MTYLFFSEERKQGRRETECDSDIEMPGYNRETDIYNADVNGLLFERKMNLSNNPSRFDIKIAATAQINIQGC
jgi:hypothetical protein